MRALASHVRARGLKLGLYTSQSSLTCQARPGSYGYEETDAHTYCDEYDADYIKIDHCGGEAHAAANTSWIKFRRALDECAARRGRRFVMSCRSFSARSDEIATRYRARADFHCVASCSSCGVKAGGGVRGCGAWIAGGGVSCDVWRTGDDIQALAAVVWLCSSL